MGVKELSKWAWDAQTARREAAKGVLPIDPVGPAIQMLVYNSPPCGSGGAATKKAGSSPWSGTRQDAGGLRSTTSGRCPGSSAGVVGSCGAMLASGYAVAVGKVAAWGTAGVGEAAAAGAKAAAAGAKAAGALAGGVVAVGYNAVITIASWF